MGTEKKKVLIVVPSWGVAPPECCDYRNDMCLGLGRWENKEDCRYEFHIGSVVDQLVQHAREVACRAAVEDKFDYIGMIDDDMIGPLNLWKNLLAHDVDVVAPLAFMRQKPHFPVIYALQGGWVPGEARRQFKYSNVRNYPKDTLVECDAVGFGAVLIKTAILQDIETPWFMSTGGSGEDILFCEKAKRAGKRVFVDTATKMFHLGPRKYIGEGEYEETNPEVKEIRDNCGDWSLEKARENLAA